MKNTEPAAKSSGTARIRQVLFDVILTVLLFLVVLLGITRSWAKVAFGGVTVDELIFHIKVPLKGTDTTTIASYIQNVVFPSALFAVLFLVVFSILPRKERAYRRRKAAQTGQRVMLRLRLRHGRIWEREAFVLPCFSAVKSLLIVLLLVALEFTALCRDFRIPEYIDQQKHPSVWLQENYADPASVSITWPEHKRNLIYIFLESMESSYFSKADGGYYDSSLIPELEALADENIHFCNREAQRNGAVSISGTTWTIAGMFAQTSGLPLKLSVGGNSMDSYSVFFPGVTSLGDLTQAAGYHNYILMGSDASFAGRRNYFEQHGNYEILDYNWAQQNGKIPQGYSVFWGFEDSRLIDMAKEKLLEVSAQDEPFNLTLLTVDTHFPNGYRCNLCKNEHDTDYKDALSCSSRQIAALVQWIQEQDFYEDTTIVISGDHLSMSSELYDEIHDYTRTVYNCIINPAVEPAAADTRTFSTMDMFPTTLAALGVQIDGDRLGLGTNLFSTRKTLPEELGVSEFNQNVQLRSEFYNNLMY